MKKTFLFCLVFILCLSACCVGYAVGKSGYAEGASEILYSNLTLSPANNSTFTTGDISWSCSVKLGNDAMNDFLSIFGDNHRFDEVRIALYELETSEYSTITGVHTRTHSNYKQTLSSKTYKSKRSVSFSANGSTYLSPGNYRIQLETRWDNSFSHWYNIYSHDFTVKSVNNNSSSNSQPSQPTSATVKVIYLLMDGSEYRVEHHTYPLGKQTVYASNIPSGYELVTGSSYNVNVTTSGNNEAYFYLRKKQSSSSGSNNSSSSSGSSNNSSSSNSSTSQSNQNTIQYGYTIERLSTRSGPGTNYASTGSYNNLKNQWVPVRARAYDSANEIWWVEVQIGDKWLWTGYKRFDSSTLSLNDLPIYEKQMVM